MELELILTGSGTSEGVPRLSCLLPSAPYECTVCKDAMYTPKSPNRRRNTGAVVRFVSPKDGERKTVLIDCGKFFWEAALHVFPEHKIERIHALLITHAHWDAMGGLDDLRDLTRISPGPGKAEIKQPLDVFLRESELNTVRSAYPYLIQTELSSGGGGIAQLNFKVVEPPKPFEAAGLLVQPLVVQHGHVTFQGFRFGDIVWLSDASSIPRELDEHLNNVDLLVLDMLHAGKHSHPSHFNLDQALDEVRRIKPKRTVFVGMCHSINHVTVNERLAGLKESEQLDVQLGFDGMSLTSRTEST